MIATTRNLTDHLIIIKTMERLGYEIMDDTHNVRDKVYTVEFKKLKKNENR